MNNRMKISRLFLAASAGITLMLAPGSFAAKHVVNFGGPLGASFRPSSFCASVGDTVQWTGPFVKYTLNSTIIPAKAAPFHADSGTTLNYIIKVGGVYNFKGNSNTMCGSFSVGCIDTAAVKSGSANSAVGSSLAKSSVSGGHTAINLNLPGRELVSASVFSVSGERVAVLADNLAGPGVHSIPLNNLSAGSYIVKLSVGGREMAVRTFVAR